MKAATYDRGVISIICWYVFPDSNQCRPRSGPHLARMDWANNMLLSGFRTLGIWLYGALYCFCAFVGLTITQNSTCTISDLDRSRLTNTRSAEKCQYRSDNRYWDYGSMHPYVELNLWMAGSQLVCMVKQLPFHKGYFTPLTVLLASLKSFNFTYMFTHLYEGRDTPNWHRRASSESHTVLSSRVGLHLG